MCDKCAISNNQMEEKLSTRKLQQYDYKTMLADLQYILPFEITERKWAEPFSKTINFEYELDELDFQDIKTLENKFVKFEKCSGSCNQCKKSKKCLAEQMNPSLLGLIGSKPYSSNIFYTIREFGIPIPKDFYDKYITEEEKEKWSPYLSE